MPSLYNDMSRLVITAINVGQGESILLSSENVTALVDCGGNGATNAGDTAAEYIRSTGDTRLDLLILTHFHDDHANGVEELLNRLDVGSLVIPEPDEEESWLADNIISLARSKNVDIIYVTKDMSLTFGEARLDIYAPLGGYGINERGLTVLCSMDGFEALMTGDMDSATERSLVQSHDLPDIELIVAGHHGSKYSSSQELLDDVTPEAAIISVGYNTYGHPTAEALQRLYGVGANVYRTDECGNITVRVK
jgi:competence protein ComEC